MTPLSGAELAEIRERDARYIKMTVGGATYMSLDSGSGVYDDRRRLLAHIDALAADAWQPIASAPRKTIIVWGGTYTHDSGDYNEWLLEHPTQVFPGARGSWVTTAEHGEFVYLPTHWRPLPAPPALASQLAEGEEPAAQKRRDRCPHGVSDLNRCERCD